MVSFREEESHYPKGRSRASSCLQLRKEWRLGGESELLIDSSIFVPAVTWVMGPGGSDMFSLNAYISTPAWDTSASIRGKLVVPCRICRCTVPSQICRLDLLRRGGFQFVEPKTIFTSLFFICEWSISLSFMCFLLYGHNVNPLIAPPLGHRHHQYSVVHVIKVYPHGNYILQ